MKRMDAIAARVRAGFRLAVVAAVLLLPASVVADPPSAAKIAEPPRLTVDTTYVAPRGKTIVVRAGGDFQAALNAANPGDVITLEAGATFTGPFTLPVKPGSEWIVVRSSAPEGHDRPPAGRRSIRAQPQSDSPKDNLPLPGHRVDPSYAHLMPQLVAKTDPVIVAAPGAHHYRFIGIEMRPDGSGRRSSWQTLRSAWRWINGARATTVGFAGQNLVLLGVAETSIEQLSHHIIFDRCYLHGDPKGGARRGIAMNSRHTAVIDSYLSDFKAVGLDTQAILGWNGPGPFKIENNYLEGAGENVMFGGAEASIPDLVPSDIEIRGNHFAKPLSWKIDDPSYEGTPWAIKNLFELKNARRVLIDGNLFEHNWVHAQNGFAILFTVRTVYDNSPWAVVEDVLFTNNVVRKSAAGVNILGLDDGSPTRSGRTRRIAIRNNLFDEIGGEQWGGSGRLFQLLEETQDVIIEHNTALQTDGIILGEGSAHTGFIFSNNIAPHNEYGIIGSGFGVGHPTLERYFPGAVVRRNVMAGGPADLYPSDNFFPASLDDVGFVNRARGDYRLKGSSAYKRAATDGGDIGVDFVSLWAAMGPGWGESAARVREENR